jgi:Tfp pilus assembly protein PilF
MRFAPTLLTLLLAAPRLLAQDFSTNLNQTQTRPDPNAALIQQANDALAASDFPAALKILTGLNATTPHNPQVLYDLGLTLEALQELPATDTGSRTADNVLTPESCYRQAIAANPLFPPPHVALGLLLARTGRAAEAHSELLTATAIPDIEPALKAAALRALARLDQKASPAAASAALLAALQLTPETPDDILLSAEIAEAAPDLDAAERAYRRYLALPNNSRDPTATAALAHILVKRHHTAEAIDLLTQAIAVPSHANDPVLNSQLVAAYLDSGDPDNIAKAAPLLKALHEAHPQDANISRLAARVYLETGHPEQADPIYAALIAAAGARPDPTLLDARAEVLIRLHRPGAAETLLKQALADPAAFPTPAALADAALHLAFAASEMDDPNTTLQALTLRATVLPPSPTALFLEATADDTLHQSQKAADMYKKFLAAAQGQFPDEELQARQRLAALEHRK